MVNICSYFFRVVRDFSGSTVWGCCCCCCGGIFLGHSRSALRKGQRPCDCSCVDRVSQQSASMFKGISPVVLRHWRPQVEITAWQLLDFLNMIWKPLKILTASALVRSLPISGHVLGCFVRMLWKPTSVWRAFEYQCSFTRLMARRKSNMLWQKVSGLILWIDSDKLATGVVAAGAHNWYSQDFSAWRLKQTFFWCHFCGCGLPKLGTSNYIEVQTSGWKSKKQIKNKFTGTQWYSMVLNASPLANVELP